MQFLLSLVLLISRLCLTRALPVNLAKVEAKLAPFDLPAPTMTVDETTGIQLDIDDHEPFLYYLLFKRLNASDIPVYVAQSPVFEHPSFQLPLAAYLGDLNRIKELMKDNRTDPTFSHNMALRLATTKNHTDIARELLKDPRVSTEDGLDGIDYTAEEIAAALNNVELYRDFLNHPSHNSEIPTGGLRNAFLKGYDELFELMLNDERVCLIGQDKALMDYAVQTDLYDVMKKLLDVPRCRNTIDSISMAVSTEHIDVLKWLLENGRLDPTVYQNYALEMAREEGKEEMVKLLLADKRVADYERKRLAKAN